MLQADILHSLFNLLAEGEVISTSQKKKSVGAENEIGEKKTTGKNTNNAKSKACFINLQINNYKYLLKEAYIK